MKAIFDAQKAGLGLANAGDTTESGRRQDRAKNPRKTTQNAACGNASYPMQQKES